LREPRMRGSEPALHVGAQKRAQRLGSQFRNRHHGVTSAKKLECAYQTRRAGRSSSRADGARAPALPAASDLTSTAYAVPQTVRQARLPSPLAGEGAERSLAREAGEGSLKNKLPLTQSSPSARTTLSRKGGGEARTWLDPCTRQSGSLG